MTLIEYFIIRKALYIFVDKGDINEKNIDCYRNDCLSDITYDSISADYFNGPNVF